MAEPNPEYEIEVHLRGPEGPVTLQASTWVYSDTHIDFLNGMSEKIYSCLASEVREIVRAGVVQRPTDPINSELLDPPGGDTGIV